MRCRTRLKGCRELRLFLGRGQRSAVLGVAASASGDSVCEVNYRRLRLERGTRMAAWRPLSARESGQPNYALYEGVSAHLSPVLIYYLQNQFGYRSRPVSGRSAMRDDLMFKVAVRARIPTRAGVTRGDLMNDILGVCLKDEGAFLDVLDALLSLSPEVADSGLDRMLLDGGSAWAVASGGKTLERRVDASARKQFEAATSAADDASRELAEAWANAYGRDPNPSDAWDHAIKAMEAALWPVVVPNNPKATLGTIEKAIAAKPSKWGFGLDSNSIGSMETLHALLKMAWPNPDRHGTGATRTPTQTEAEAVVHISVTIVQWVRAGLFRLASL